MVDLGSELGTIFSPEHFFVTLFIFYSEMSSGVSGLLLTESKLFYHGPCSTKDTKIFIDKRECSSVCQEPELISEQHSFFPLQWWKIKIELIGK